MVNQILFQAINNLAGKYKILDNLMIISAKYLVVVLAAFLVYLFIRKKKKFVFVFLSMLVSLVISKLIGWFFYFPRPFISTGISLIEHVADSGFPSDHGVAFFSAAFSLLLVKEKKVGIIFIFLAILVSFARIFTSLHYPIDVLGSIIVSGIGVSLVYFLFRAKIK